MTVRGTLRGRRSGYERQQHLPPPLERSEQRGTTAQKKAAGRKGGKAAAKS